MALDRFNDDLNYVGNLGDDPKRDNGLSTPQFKSYFDKAGLAIQNFINNKLIPQIENYLDEGTVLGKISEALNTKMNKTGDTMKGPINMNGQRLTGLNAPTATNEAATKGYVDNKLSMELLREIADHTSKFEAGAIPVDLSKAKAVMVVGRYSTSVDWYCSVVVPVGVSAVMRIRWNEGACRIFTAKTNHVAFDVGKKIASDGTLTTDNTYMIPTHIYALV